MVNVKKQEDKLFQGTEGKKEKVYYSKSDNSFIGCYYGPCINVCIPAMLWYRKSIPKAASISWYETMTTIVSYWTYDKGQKKICS